MEVRKCEGSCDPHEGEVIKVITESERWPPMTFWYCQTAIAEDRGMGFIVTPVSELED